MCKSQYMLAGKYLELLPACVHVRVAHSAFFHASSLLVVACSELSVHTVNKISCVWFLFASSEHGCGGNRVYCVKVGIDQPGGP